MDGESLEKLSVLLRLKFREVSGLASGRPCSLWEMSRRWVATCDSVGIRSSKYHWRIPDYDPKTQTVTVDDPYSGGISLEMSRETAERILVLGMP